MVFSGSIARFDELELFNIVNNLLLWNDSPEVNEWFPGFKSSKIIEFKNEFLELLKMPRGKDFFVYLYSDDCPVCDSNKEFYDDLAEQFRSVKNIHSSHCDMTASIFWGIWPYDLPQTRYYTSTVSNNFEYVYELYTMEAYYKFLKQKSMIFKKHLGELQRPQIATYKEGSLSYSRRHCYNKWGDAQQIKNYLRFHNVDYDKIVDLELQKPYAEKLDGYNIYSFDSFNDIELKYPFFKLVQKTSGADVKVALVGASLYEGDREKLFMLMSHGYMILGI